MGPNDGQERDWSSLPPEVLNLIAKKISEISDFVRFRAVCTAWFSSTPTSDLAPQFPWLVQDCGNSSDTGLRFYSIPFHKTYIIQASKKFDTLLLGPSEGYMLFYCSKSAQPTHQVSLLNPLTNHEFPLPEYNFGTILSWFGPQQNQMRECVVSYGYGVFCRHQPKLVLWHSGQDKWCKMDFGSEYENCNRFYCNSMLFNIVRDTGVTKVLDVATGALVYDVPSIEGFSGVGTDYIVEASGVILRVRRRHAWFSDPLHSEKFDVFRLDVIKSGSPCWVKVDNIGDHALFVDLNGVLTLRSNDFSKVKQNSIYYSVSKFVKECQREIYEFKRVDIETGSVEHFPCYFKEQMYWFVPNLQH